MDRQRGQVREGDHFGFDPIFAPARTREQITENDDIRDCDTSKMRNSSYEVATKTSSDELEPHSVPKSRLCKDKSPSFSAKLLDGDNTRTTQDFWGFDPAINPNQKPADLRQVRSQHNRDNKYTPEK